MGRDEDGGSVVGGCSPGEGRGSHPREGDSSGDENEPKKDLQDSVCHLEEAIRRQQVPARAIGLDASIDKKPEK